MRAIALLLVTLLGVIAPGFATAHPMAESRVWVDTTAQGLNLTLNLPLNQLGLAYGHTLDGEPHQVLAREREGLSRYLLAHIGARSGTQGWLALRPELSVSGQTPAAELVAQMRLVAPIGQDPRQGELLLDVVTHEVRSHRVQVFLRHDWASGRVVLAEVLPQPLAELRYGQGSVALTLPAARTGASWLSLWQHGMAHIAEGSDHLAFLLLLVVVAPLGMNNGRWAAPRPARQAWQHIGWVVSAFTLGHALTLTLGSTGWLSLPSQWVEVGVALTIALAAVHALRPIFGRGETLVALGFGLVHGMAFSASLSGAGLSAWQHAQALMAFNLGIETMQGLVLLATLPPLLKLAGQGQRLAWLRRGLAIACFDIALLWTAERLAWLPTGTSAWVDSLLSQGIWLPGMLWLIALWPAHTGPTPCRQTA